MRPGVVSRSRKKFSTHKSRIYKLQPNISMSYMPSFHQYTLFYELCERLKFFFKSSASISLHRPCSDKAVPLVSIPFTVSSSDKMPPSYTRYPPPFFRRCRFLGPESLCELFSTATSVSRTLHTAFYVLCKVSCILIDSHRDVILYECLMSKM